MLKDLDFLKESSTILEVGLTHQQQFTVLMN